MTTRAPGLSPPAWMRSGVAVLRDRSLRGVRARFGCFLAFGSLLCLPSIVLAHDAAVGTRLLGVAGLGWLLAARWREYATERLAPPWSDLVDAVALLAVIAPDGPEPVAALLFGLIYFRALFAKGARAVLSLGLYAVAFAVGTLVVYPAGNAYPPGLLAGSTVGALIVGYLMYTLRASLTAREDALRTEHEAVVRSQAFLSTVLDNLTDGVVACDTDGRITVFNDEAGVLHRSTDRVIPMEKWAEAYGLYRLDGVTPLAPHEVPLRRALAGESVTDAEVVMQAVDGSRRVALVSGQPILDEGGRITGAVVTIHDVTDRRAAELELVHQSMHDQLTGLPNRALLLDRIEHALTRRSRHPSPLCLLFLDLDHFKNVNDTLGHGDGDALLCVVAERIRRELHADDTAARLGGDEYAILLEDTPPEEGLALARRLLDVLREPIHLPGRSWVVHASVGVASAEEGMDAITLLRNADLAMYAAKRGGRNGVREFAQPMYDAALAQAELLSELQDALRREEFFLVYQPLVSLRSGQAYGAEALLRWDHPRHGVVAPMDFIPAAESSGLISELGLWVLRTACREGQAWQPPPGDRDPFLISVNLSPRQLADPGLTAAVRQALADADLAPGALALEVTETALQDDEGSAEAVLGELHELGVTISLDDFGTGYSSLGRLRAFPFGVIKIDRSFVAEIDQGNTAVVEAALGLARSLGLRTVAEGVETRRQLEALTERGCDAVQGYLLSPPVSAQRLTELLGLQHGASLDRAAVERISGPVTTGAQHEAGAA